MLAWNIGTSEAKWRWSFSRDTARRAHNQWLPEPVLLEAPLATINTRVPQAGGGLYGNMSPHNVTQHHCFDGGKSRMSVTSIDRLACSWLLEWAYLSPSFQPNPACVKWFWQKSSSMAQCEVCLWIGTTFKIHVVSNQQRPLQCADPLFRRKNALNALANVRVASAWMQPSDATQGGKSGRGGGGSCKLWISRRFFCQPSDAPPTSFSKE